jgi:hypothetical protein
MRKIGGGEEEIYEWNSTADEVQFVFNTSWIRSTSMLPPNPNLDHRAFPWVKTTLPVICLLDVNCQIISHLTHLMIV